MNMERSLILIKPDAVQKGTATAIISRIESQGLKLIAIRMLQMEKALAEKHYAPHKERPFFPGLLTYITSAPVVAAVFEGEDAVARIRRIMGSTDPAKAEAGTIRKDFGENIERNAIHGSDSTETAAREISLFFSSDQLMHYQRQA
jgi:nucleoside-diphosphate kinase